MSKRKLKPLWKRRHKDKVSNMEILREIERRTGFKYSDVRIILRTFSQIIKESLLDRKSVWIEKVGIIYPMIKPARIGVALNGMGLKSVKNPKPIEKIKVPPMLVLKLQPSTHIAESLKGVKLSKEDIDGIYED